jgi:hypothetical protein
MSDGEGSLFCAAAGAEKIRAIIVNRIIAEDLRGRGRIGIKYTRPRAAAARLGAGLLFAPWAIILAGKYNHIRK